MICLSPRCDQTGEPPRRLGPLNIPHNLAHLDAARLVEQQHSARALFLSTELLLRRREQEIRGPRARVGLGEGIGARSEQHLAAAATTFGSGRR
jgi:hypothetical protein